MKQIGDDRLVAEVDKATMELTARRVPSADLRSFYFPFLLPAALIALFLAFGAVDRSVLSAANLLNIAQQASYLAIFSMAQMIVLVTRGFDLSLGPTVSLVSVAAALTMSTLSGGAPASAGIWIVLAGVGVGMIVGLLVGAFNGITVAGLKVNPFVATLGSYNICTGVATSISGGKPVQGVPTTYSSFFYGGGLFGLPSAIVFAALVGGIVALMLRYTVFGRSLYIIGSNAVAAKVAGLPTARYLFAAYVLSSGLSAIGAMMLTARTGSGEPNLGGALSLQSIAAAVVGGVSLAGGRGGVGSALLGALFITVLSNGMNLTRIDGYVQMIVLGVIVIAGVVLDRLRPAARA
jgi:ribose transport system permease protein